MSTDILAGVALILFGVIIIVSSAYRFMTAHQRTSARNFEEGFNQGWKQHVAAFRMETPDYDRGYTDGWCALLDILDDPKSPGPDRAYVIVRRKP